jgi:hypothetical protein
VRWEILGHKTIQMTQGDAHPHPAYRRAMAERMEKLWSKPTRCATSPEQVLGLVKMYCSDAGEYRRRVGRPLESLQMGGPPLR